MPTHVSQGGSQYPYCTPALPEAEVLLQPSLHSIVLEVATALEVAHLYNDDSNTNNTTTAPHHDWPPPPAPVPCWPPHFTNNTTDTKLRTRRRRSADDSRSGGVVCRSNKAGGASNAFMGEVTRLSDWFGSFWVKQSDGSRKVMRYSSNEFTQVTAS